MDVGPSSSNTFNSKDLCFICNEKLNRKNKVVQNITHEEKTKQRFILICEKNDDSKSRQIIDRLNSVDSLVNVQAAYHKICYTRLAQAMYPTKAKKVDRGYEAAIKEVIEFIEVSDKHKYTHQELKEIMGDNFRSNDTLFTGLKKHFGNELNIVHARGKPPTYLYKKADIGQICADWHYEKNNISESAKDTILKVAAGILQDEIMEHSYENTYFPPSDHFLDNVSEHIPHRLTNFLGNWLCTTDTYTDDSIAKRDMIAHIAISTLRPKSFISTLQLAVGTYIYRKTGSKLIIQLLSKLGISSPYSTIQLYEASTIMNPPKFTSDDAFVQFVFDNTDHNVNTLDGRETFHCLGGIAVYTPGCNVKYDGNTKKLGKMPSATELAKQKQIRTIPFVSNGKPTLQKIKYTSINSRDIPALPLLRNYYTTYLLAKQMAIPAVPTWKGYMKVITSSVDFTVSHISCLPFINEPPSNLTTINTSLHYALNTTNNLKQKTCFVTYDQPLYLKARSIVSHMEDSTFQNIVVRLGGFHLLMSYLGAIGHIMAGSGLEDYSHRCMQHYL